MRSRLFHAAFGLAATGAVLVSVSALGAAPSAAQTAKTEHFLIVSSNSSDSAPQWVVARGPIHALGKDKEVGNRDRFIFPQGVLKVSHHAKSDHTTQDNAACLSTYTESGTFKVTGGTRAYAGASGSGRYHLRATIVACGQNQKPKYFSVVVKAKGKLSL
jgi:hypothetical protein